MLHYIYIIKQKDKHYHNHDEMETRSIEQEQELTGFEFDIRAVQLHSRARLSTEPLIGAD